MSNISLKKDGQYLLTAALLISVFLYTDFIGILEKSDFAYYSGRLLIEPYRIITSHFIHSDIGHLLANIGGIIICRFFLIELKNKNNILFILTVLLLIPLQSFLQFLIDIYIFNNYHSLLIGFSGIIYGVFSYLFLSANYGKQSFLNIKINLISNFKLKESLFVIIGIGFIWSLLPGISFTGHFTGFIAGAILFLL